jgi:hypothetical protein
LHKCYIPLKSDNTKVQNLEKLPFFSFLFSQAIIKKGSWIPVSPYLEKTFTKKGLVEWLKE